MDNNALKKIKDELESKVDEATLNRLKAAKSPEDALSILDSVSIQLDDDMLDAVSGGGMGGNWNKPFVWDCTYYTD